MPNALSTSWAASSAVATGLKGEREEELAFGAIRTGLNWQVGYDLIELRKVTER